ncbi:MAG: Uma2 family endonuclease [Pseudomonadota bacterium]
MPKPVKKRAVYDDLHKLPENMTGEIIEGELHAFPRPHSRHAKSTSVLSGELMPPYYFGRGGGPGGWIILIEPEVMLGDDLVAPDLAGWKKDRLPKLPKKNWISVVPDWVCEMLSPSARGYDRIKKMPLYGQFAVKHVWLLDPLDRTLEVYQLENGRWTAIGFYGENDKVKAEPFAEIEINLADFWMEEEEA